MSKNTSAELRDRRQKRGRKKIFGTPERPRLAVYRSTKHVYAQVIDDSKGVTICAASTKADHGDGDKKKRAEVVGKLIAERAKAAKVETVVFDRGGFLYHGRVAALADAARKNGLRF